MSEVKLFEKLKTIFNEAGKEFHLQRHEDAYSNGIPDVSFGIDNVNGWIELKYDDCFPVEYKTKLRKEQKPWLIKRGRAAGNCFVLHQLGDIFMLIPYENIMAINETLQKDSFTWCDKVFFGKLDSSILDYLVKRQAKPRQINGIDHF